MTLPYDGKNAKERFMKKIFFILAALTCAFFIGCQNTTEADGGKDSGKGQNPSDLPANTISFKFNGNQVTISNSVYTVGGGATVMGKELQGEYIQAATPTVLTGTYDKNTNPKFSMFYAENGTAYLSDVGAANMTFNVTVTATEVTGTFSGTLRKNTAPNDILPVTDGTFRVTK